MTDPTGRHHDATTTPRPDRPDAGPLPLVEAAGRLGISPDAARKRLERGTLRGEKRAGRWVVWLDPEGAPDTTQDATWTPLDARADAALVAALESEITFLRSELAARTEEVRRRDHLLAAALERRPELPATIEHRPVAPTPADDPRAGPGNLWARLRRLLGG
jgi:hypothetical protein